MRLRIVAKKLDKYGEVISYVDNTTYEDKFMPLLYYTEDTNFYFPILSIRYKSEGEVEYSYTYNPFVICYDSFFDHHKFNPAQSVYLKITSARRPTHE